MVKQIEVRYDSRGLPCLEIVDTVSSTSTDPRLRCGPVPITYYLTQLLAPKAPRNCSLGTLIQVAKLVKFLKRRIHNSSSPYLPYFPLRSRYTSA
jgi:hypothetical protein